MSTQTNSDNIERLVEEYPLTYEITVKAGDEVISDFIAHGLDDATDLAGIAERLRYKSFINQKLEELPSHE